MIYAGNAHSQRRAKRLNVQSVVVFLDKIKYKSGTLATDELIYLQNQESFKISVFKEMSKSSGDCRGINQKVI